MYQGPYGEAVRRSLMVLKSLSYAPTGGIVAAVTTSLPEQIGGGRNWDYRFCWLRDASLTLFALMDAGFTEEAGAWRDWLQRSIAGSADQIQIMYGLHGERSLDERELSWLPGYEQSAPVRIGNAASTQVQLDVYGEVLNCLHQARRNGLKNVAHGWALQVNITEHLAQIWDQPDEGMWEIRGGAQHFTLSKIMAWVAIDRMIRDSTDFGLEGPVDEWRALAETIRKRVLSDGYDAKRNTFVQYFGSKELDASLSSAPSRQSRKICCRMVSCCATAPRARWTACRPAKAHSSPAPSGWSTLMSGRAVSTKPARCSNGCSAIATMSIC
jgi:glucoamylase